MEDEGARNYGLLSNKNTAFPRNFFLGFKNGVTLRTIQQYLGWFCTKFGTDLVASIAPNFALQMKFSM